MASLMIPFLTTCLHDPMKVSLEGGYTGRSYFAAFNYGWLVDESKIVKMKDDPGDEGLLQLQV